MRLGPGQAVVLTYHFGGSFFEKMQIMLKKGFCQKTEGFSLHPCRVFVLEEIAAVTSALRDGWLAPGPRSWAHLKTGIGRGVTPEVLFPFMGKTR